MPDYTVDIPYAMTATRVVADRQRVLVRQATANRAVSRGADLLAQGDIDGALEVLGSYAASYRSLMDTSAEAIERHVLDVGRILLQLPNGVALTTALLEEHGPVYERLTT